MAEQNLLRSQINTMEKEISSLHDKKFELKKELLQEIHNFKIGDFIAYEKSNGKLVYGRVDIINNTNKTKSGQVIVYSNKQSENYFMRDYTIVHLFDWYKEPDPKLRVLSRHNLGEEG